MSDLPAYITKRKPLRPTLGPDNPETIAKEAIRRVELAIWEKFGLEVEGGVELEYGVYIPGQAKPYPRILKEKPKALRSDYNPSGHRKKHADPLFPKSPSVAYSYPENEAHGSDLWPEHRIHDHETVISHHGLHRRVREHKGDPVAYRSIPMGEGRFVQLASEVESLRRGLPIRKRNSPERLAMRNQ